MKVILIGMLVSLVCAAVWGNLKELKLVRGAEDVANGAVDCAPITTGDNFTIYYRSNQ